MTDKVLIDRALLQDLIDDVSDYAESRSFKKVEWHWRTELLEKARALLAAGASEGQAEPIYQVKRVHGWIDVPESRYTEIKEDPNDCGELRILYLRPSAEIAALRERIAGMEKDAYRSLIARHAEELEQNDYAYFELAYTRRTGWMAWICSNSREDDPSRKVIACGQGDTPDEACAAAIAKEPK